MYRQILSIAVAWVITFQGVFTFGQEISPAFLSGLVTDLAGHPISADLVVYGRAIVDGHLDLFAMCATTTDLEGIYKCTNLRAGSYIVSALARDEKEQTGTAISSKVFPRTFFPQATTLNDAMPVELLSGGSAMANIVMRPSEPGTLYGEVPGHPKSASFLVRSHLGKFDLPVQGSLVYDPASGRFVINALASGTYSISADWSVSSIVHHGYATVEVIAGDSRQVVMKAVSQHTVKGVIHPASDNPLKRPLPSSITLEGMDDDAGWNLSAKINKDGSFIFPPVWDGNYLLRTGDETQFYTVAISHSGKRCDCEQLQLTSDVDVSNIDVELGLTNASVSGIAEKNHVAPSKSGVVLLSVKDQRVSVSKISDDGRFSFKNVPPGEYMLFGWTDLSQVEYRNPAVLTKKKNLSKSITIDDDSQIMNIDLSLIAPVS